MMVETSDRVPDSPVIQACAVVVVALKIHRANLAVTHSTSELLMALVGN